MGNSKGKQQENYLQQQTQAAATKVAEVDPLEQKQRDYIGKLAAIRDGETPFNIHNLPGGAMAVALYNDAKKAKDAGRIGKGYGSLSDGANPNFAVSLDKEMGLERDLAASGALEGHVNDIFSGLDAKMMGLSQASDSRDMSVANLYNTQYQAFLNRPKQPTFLKQLALGLTTGLQGMSTTVV